VDTLPGLIGHCAAALPPGAALLDTGSTRRGLATALRGAAARGLRVVGGHPIAGNEGHGFGAARADLFRDAAFALLPARGGVPAIVRELVHDLGARPLRVTPGLHDRALARTSHVPYLLARALYDRGARFSSAGLSGSGFRDMTRLAGSDPRVAEAYCRANVREVERAWREVRNAVERRLRSLRRP
jgi:prephenate dehydrogenase